MPKKELPQKDKISHLLSILEQSKQEEEVGLAYLKRKIESCRRCKLADTRTQPLSGEFPPKAKRILFVSDAPKLQDDAVGKLMVGIHGEQFANLVLQELGLKRGTYNISTVVKCLCLGNVQTGKKKRIPIDPIFWCVEYLYKQIAIIRPRLIVGMGQTPFFVFLYKNDERFALKELVPLGEFVGNLYKAKMILGGGEIPYFQTYDPASWLKSKSIQTEVRKHFKKIRRILDDIHAERCIENLYTEFVDPVWALREKRFGPRVSPIKGSTKKDN